MWDSTGRWCFFSHITEWSRKLAGLLFLNERKQIQLLSESFGYWVQQHGIWYYNTCQVFVGSSAQNNIKPYARSNYSSRKYMNLLWTNWGSLPLRSANNTEQKHWRFTEMKYWELIKGYKCQIWEFNKCKAKHTKTIEMGWEEVVYL